MKYENDELRLLRAAKEQARCQEQRDFAQLQQRLAQQPQAPLRSRRRWAAICASFGLVLVIGTLALLGPRLGALPIVHSDPDEPTVTATTPPEVLSAGYTAADYDQVYLALQTLAATKSHADEAVDIESAAQLAEAQAEAEDSSAMGTPGNGSDHGTTNVQVAGVDEADIVKTDGERIYVLSDYYAGYGPRITVLQAEDLTVLDQIPLNENDEGYNPTAHNQNHPLELYLDGDTLVILSSRERPDKLVSYDKEPVDSPSAQPQEEVPPPSELVLSYQQETVLHIYHVDPQGKLTLQRTFSQDGFYETSRKIEDQIYLVTTKDCYPNSSIQPAEVFDYLPTTSDSDRDTDLCYVPPGQISLAEQPSNTFTILSGISLSGNADSHTETFLGSYSNAIYCSKEALYLTAYHPDGMEVIKYSLAQDGVSLTARNVIPGSSVFLRNQFSMDEYQGKLRIAVTQHRDGESVNLVYVLDENLSIIGQTNPLAPGETIQSVRYLGTMAYVVTFRQTDPLFAIDLSDPEHPNVLGYLKIPGFSTYLHPLDDETLIGIGYHTDDNGITLGIKCSLFDVSDPKNPKERSLYTLQGDCDSAAAYDHKAVTYLADEGLLLLPLEIYGNVQLSVGYTLGADSSGSVLVLNVSKTEGFSLKGIIKNETEPSGIQRTTYVGRTLYTVSLGSVMAVDRDTLSPRLWRTLIPEEVPSTPISPNQTYD